MQFFTPQLYQQFNSRDEAEAERANEKWEEAIRAYKESLEHIRDQMPSQVVALSELCLHDAEVLAREEIHQAHALPFEHEDLFPIWSTMEVITVHLDTELLSLFYALWDRVRIHEAPDTWHFSKLREHWLYDEIHVQNERRWPLYTHSILFSTGIVLNIPFVSVVLHRVPLPQTASEKKKRA
jgi:hypothetical protein